MTNLALRSIYVHTSTGSLTCRKILRHGAPDSLSVRRKTCCRFLSHLKIHHRRPGLNQQILGTVARTLTITPPRTMRELRYRPLLPVILDNLTLRNSSGRVTFSSCRPSVSDSYHFPSSHLFSLSFKPLVPTSSLILFFTCFPS
jgi:hypothetical protein